MIAAMQTQVNRNTEQATEETFEIYDARGKKLGLGARSQVHGNPALVHRVAHVLVFNSAGQLFLQKRSDRKDVEPGKWDTSVGGHLHPGESYLAAARREMAEELGIRANLTLVHLFDYAFRSNIESEDVRTFAVVYDGPVTPNADEISEGRFWTSADIRKATGTDVFTPSLEQELGLYGQWRGLSA
jgi:isopentenyldiphosphate isomerase